MENGINFILLVLAIMVLYTVFSSDESMEEPVIEPYRSVEEIKDDVKLPDHLKPYVRPKRVQGTGIIDHSGRNGNWNFRYGTRPYDPSKGFEIYKPTGLYCDRVAI